MGLLEHLKWDVWTEWELKDLLNLVTSSWLVLILVGHFCKESIQEIFELFFIFLINSICNWLKSLRDWWCVYFTMEFSALTKDGTSKATLFLTEWWQISLLCHKVPLRWLKKLARKFRRMADKRQIVALWGTVYPAEQLLCLRSVNMLWKDLCSLSSTIVA